MFSGSKGSFSGISVKGMFDSGPENIQKEWNAIGGIKDKQNLEFVIEVFDDISKELDLDFTSIQEIENDAEDFVIVIPIEAVVMKVLKNFDFIEVLAFAATMSKVFGDEEGKEFNALLEEFEEWDQVWDAKKYIGMKELETYLKTPIRIILTFYKYQNKIGEIIDLEMVDEVF